MDPNDDQPPPEPTLPSAEQMRARRLAKLGNMSSAPKETGGDGAAAAGSTAQPASGASGASTSSAPASAPASTPASTSSTPMPKITITPRPSSAAQAPASAAQGSGNPSLPGGRSAADRASSPSKRRRLLLGGKEEEEQEEGDGRPTATLSANGPTDLPSRQGGQAASAASATTPAAAAADAAARAAAALAEWTDSTISTVLRVTANPDHPRDRHGHPLAFLKDLRQDILERIGVDEQQEQQPEQKPEEKPSEGQGSQPEAQADGPQGPSDQPAPADQPASDQPASDQPTQNPPRVLLAIDDIDAALLESCTAVPHKKPLLDHLLPCYKTVGRLLKARNTVPQRAAVLQELRRLIMSNMVFALTMPEYFGREPNPQHDTLVPYLLRGVQLDDPLSLDMDFITDAVSRFDDDDEHQLEAVFTRAMVDISHTLSTMTMNDEYLPYIEAMLTYTRFKPLLVAVANHPSFQMAQSAPNIERFTLLGPFFRISPLQAEVSKAYFGGAHKVELARKDAVYGALQMTLSAHQSNLHSIAMAFARAGDAPRNKLLDWFAYTMNVNHKRRALQVSPKEVASDGFMMNIAAVLDRMCEPFMEASFARMERIEISYLRRKPRIDIRDETKLDADQAQADAFYARALPGESKFVSELFFLNMASHHYGSGAAGQKFKDMDREIKHIEGQLAMLEEERKKLLAAGAGAANPRALVVVEQHLKNYTAAVDRHVAYKYALEAVLLDEKMQQRTLMFMRYVSVWLLRVASGSDYVPGRELHLPLPREQPEAFRCLPEYALQNVVEHVRFLFRRVPRILPSAVGDEMVALCITFLESSEYIRNPYLKSSLVSLLFSGTWRMYHLANGVLGDALTNSKFANKYLLHALMKFYIECESTGAHTQFYDKFNIRYEIFQVIKAVWPNDLYKRQLTQQSQTNRAFFVQFVNLLLNDATYVLDEALSRFPKIHELQKELQNPDALSSEERQQRESALQAAEGQAQSYMQLANETVSMMKLFTEALSDAFTMPEIVSRLAGMLDYNLVTLAGPTSRNLKVENPEKYFFNPKVLLPQIVELYLNLGNKPTFVDAVAADGRSYKPDIFDNATRILTTKGLMDPEKLQAWDALLVRFAKAKELVDQAELDLGEIPDEFEDPIMGDLMKDPVVLPSRHIVDRSTIVQHLLSDPIDPFTRQPMTVDDVKPATELKQQIEQWKAERMAAAAAAKKAAAGGGGAEPAAESATSVPAGFEDDAMDTTEG